MQVMQADGMPRSAGVPAQEATGQHSGYPPGQHSSNRRLLRQRCQEGQCKVAHGQGQRASGSLNTPFKLMIKPFFLCAARKYEMVSPAGCIVKRKRPDHAGIDEFGVSFDPSLDLGSPADEELLQGPPSGVPLMHA